MAVNTELHEIFCQNVRIIRGRMALTQVDLAKRLKVGQNVVSQIENGRNDPTLTTVNRIAKALKVSPAELLTPQRADR